MTESASQFFCQLCNRRYRWSQAVAGKKLRCRCGEPIEVPAYEPLAQPPPSRAPAPGRSSGIDYGAQRADDEGFASSFKAIAAHPWRNLVFPAAYIIAAVVALSIAISNLCSSAMVALGLWIFLLGSTAVVAGGMILFGLMRGRQLEISFVSFAVATAKMVAIILFVDAAAFTLTNYWLNIGVFTRHMYLTPRLVIVFLGVYLGFFGVMLFAASYPLFNNQDDDFVALGFPVAAGLWVAHVILIVGTMTGSYVYHKATYVPPPPPPPAPAPVQTGPPPVMPTSGDEQIIARIQRHNLIEGRAFEHIRMRNDHGAIALVETLYAAGAAHVYFDLHSAFANGFPDRAYVQLPEDPARQATCKAAADKFLADTKTPPLDVPPGMYKKFIMVPLK